MASEAVEVEGHIIDSLILAKVLDTIVDAGADYRMVDVTIGRTSTDTSRARIEVVADDEELLAALLAELQLHGANRVAVEDARLVPSDTDGVLPESFYSTTNLPTQVRIQGRWVDVENPEMDCAIVVRGGGSGGAGDVRVRTEPMHR
ncbi:MAG: bifunctional protein conserved domain protein, partial [Acidimicrobiales bacterium]|nr:bifunctional protein conserved domain protein [Acidimicrobiales bacterium]